ncbi:hypothetical protein ACFX19_015209 [Malus domestica]
MAHQEVEKLVVHLENSIDLLAMEHGVKLVGTTLVKRTLNKWGVRNILRSTWKDFGEIDVKWVKENTFVITVKDSSMATKILEQVLWAMMKKNFIVKMWPSELALEEEAGEFIEMEDPIKALGFLKVKLNINTSTPLVNGSKYMGAAGYGEWSKAAPIRGIVEAIRPMTVGMGDMRHVGAVRNSLLPPSQKVERTSRSETQVMGSNNVLTPEHGDLSSPP